MSFKSNRSNSLPAVPDLEKGSSNSVAQAQLDEPNNEDPYAGNTQSTDRDPRAGEQSADDDSDTNDEFWKLFHDEAITEAKWKVSIWKRELDSLLVFAGLFAAVVSAFLIDLRLHLRPDPQLIALNQIISILNHTGPVEFEKPSRAVRAVGFLWYGSLVFTLIGAIWCVLSTGWLGENLSESANNHPADRALERWRRDGAATQWNMRDSARGIPLLTQQVGLAMFLSGFVVQSFGDNHAIGLEVLAYVVWGAFTYALFTLLPWFLPDFPYRTSLTDVIHLVPPVSQTMDPYDANTESQIKILTSRLNRSSNDEMFCSAAAILAAKFESSESKKWYRGVENRASGIAEALSVRLKSFSDKVKQIKDTASSSIAGHAIVGNFHSPAEQGITCLHLLLKSLEASVSSQGDKFESLWIKQGVDQQWRLSDIFPDKWRLLSLSIHITSLVAKKVDCDTEDIEEIDWENMIRKTFSDLTLRASLGASACRGLLHGKANLKRECAMSKFIRDSKATTPSDRPKQIFFEKDRDSAFDAGKAITENIWSELVKIWKHTVIQLLSQAHVEREEKDSFVNLLGHKLYRSDVKASISETILKQLNNKNWTTRKNAVQMLTKLAEHDTFREAIEASGAIAKVIGMLEDDDDNDVRAVAVKALSVFSEQNSDAFAKIMKTEEGVTKLIAKITNEDSEVRAAALDALLKFSTNAKLYQHDFGLTISSIFKQLDNEDSWVIREEIVKTLMKLVELDIFQKTLKTEGLIPKLVAKLEDNNSDVQDAVVAAILALSARESYQNTIKSYIPIMIKQLDHDRCSIREKIIQMLVKLFEIDVFRETMNINGIIPKILAKIEDINSDVRAAGIGALHAFSTSSCDLYYSNVKSSVPSIIEQLDNEGCIIRREAIHMLTMLAEHVGFQETIKTSGVITKFIAKLEDCDNDVRTAAIKALVILAQRDYFKEVFNSGNIISNIFGRLSDSYSSVRLAAVEALSTLSTHETYTKEIKSLVSVSSFVQQLQDESWNTRQQAIKILEQFALNTDFHVAMNTEKTVHTLAAMLADDHNEDVRAAAAAAVSVFGAQESFQKKLEAEKIISKLIAKLWDPYGKVRNAAQSTLLVLSEKALYQGDIKSGIPVIMKQLEDKNWSTRQQAILMLAKLSEHAVFQETLKMEMFVTNLVDRLIGDRVEDVRAAAAHTLSVLGTKDLFQEGMKSEKAIPKLISKLVDDNDGVRSAVYDALLELGKQDDVTRFLQTVVSTLNTVEEPVRAEVYKFLNALKVSRGAFSENAFLKQVDTEICKLLTQMKQKDLSFIFRSIAILSETRDEGLKGDDLMTANAANKSARDAVETIIHSKLVYDKKSPDQSEVVLALSRLAKHDIFVVCMKSAISGLTEAVSSNDRNVRTAAVEAISALARKDEFRIDLVPAVQKLTRQLNGWSEDHPEEYPLNLIEAMDYLVKYKEFRGKLKDVVPILMDMLPNSPKDIRNDMAFDQDDDKKQVAFYKATCKLISDLCEIQAVGRELVPKLTPVLSNMGISLTEDLLHLVTTLINYGHLNMNDRIALASSLRISSSGHDNLDIQICKLNMAALLDEAHKIEHAFSDYSLVFNAVLGHGNENIKSTLSTLVSPLVAANKLEVDM